MQLKPLFVSSWHFKDSKLYLKFFRFSGVRLVRQGASKKSELATRTEMINDWKMILFFVRRFNFLLTLILLYTIRSLERY